MGGQNGCFARGGVIMRGPIINGRSGLVLNQYCFIINS